jgi:tetratricopeptide (TPR) repeat protein
VISLALYRLAAFSVALLFPVALFAQTAPLPPGTSDSDVPATTQAQAQGQTATGPLADAEAAIDAKDYDKARGILDAYLSAHNGDARALFDRGYCDDAQGRDDAAMGYYRKAIAANPEQFEAHLALGLLLEEKNSDDARGELETATKLNPVPPNPAAKAQAYRSLARLLRTSDTDEAKAALLEALKLTPETPGDTLLTAEIAAAAGNPDIAEEAYRRVLTVNPESGPAIAGLAHLLIKEKKYDEAAPLIHSALLRDPNDPALNAQYAALLGAQGKSDEALATLEKLHSLQPNDQQIYAMLADGYLQAGEDEKADTAYTALLAASPNDPELLFSRGQVLIREQKYPDAIELFQRAVKIDAKDADVWAGIAFAASKTGQSSLELDALATRSKLAAETPVTYFLWATAHDKLHHNVQAVEYYRLFLSSALGKFPDEEWQAKQRLAVLNK